MIEPDLEKRRALEKAVAQVIEEHNPDREQRIRGQRQVSQELGFANYRALCEELSGQDLRALGKQMSGFPKATDEAYRARIADAFRSEDLWGDYEVRLAGG